MWKKKCLMHFPEGRRKYPGSRKPKIFYLTVRPMALKATALLRFSSHQPHDICHSAVGKIALIPNDLLVHDLKRVKQMEHSVAGVMAIFRRRFEYLTELQRRSAGVVAGPGDPARRSSTITFHVWRPSRMQSRSDS